jgi:large subunit ribosomal protein L22
MSTKSQQKNNVSTLEAQAVLRYLRIAPRKVRLVANLIKKKSIDEAQAQLMLNPKRSAVPILKLLRSAIENAKAKKMDTSKLFVADIRVDQGPMLKRWMPRAQGRATPIHKYTSHVVIVLKESEKSVKSRFVIENKKVKDKKEKKEHKHHQETDIHHHEHEEQKKKLSEEVVKETKNENKGPQKGFVQKIFRRKSV